MEGTTISWVSRHSKSITVIYRYFGCEWKRCGGGRQTEAHQTHRVTKNKTLNNINCFPLHRELVQALCASIATTLHFNNTTVIAIFCFYLEVYLFRHHLFEVIHEYMFMYDDMHYQVMRMKMWSQSWDQTKGVLCAEARYRLWGMPQ